MRKKAWILLCILFLMAMFLSACGEDIQEEAREGWELYENPYYTLEHPENFRIQEEDLEAMISTLFVDENEEVMVGVTMTKLPEDLTEDEIYSIWEEDIEEMEEALDEVFVEERTIQGSLAYEVHFIQSPGEKIFRVLTVHEGFLFSMDARVPAEGFDEFVSTPRSMIDSLEFQE